jgi:hypothetical protein
MRRNQGAILTLVIVALILVGVVMFVLTGGANVMLFQADTAYLQAVQRSLIASGLAWARERVAHDLDAPGLEPVALDPAAFGLPGTKLVVRILEVRQNTARVHLEIFCHKGRRTLKTSCDYECALRPAARKEPVSADTTGLLSTPDRYPGASPRASALARVLLPQQPPSPGATPKRSSSVFFVCNGTRSNKFDSAT